MTTLDGYATKFIVVGMRPSCTRVTAAVFREFTALRGRYMADQVVGKRVWTTKAKNRVSVYSHEFDFEGRPAAVFFVYPRNSYTKFRLNSTTKKTVSNIVTFSIMWAGTRVFAKFFQNGCVQVTGLQSSDTVDGFVPALLASMSFAWAGAAPELPAFRQEIFLINEGCRIRNFDICRYCDVSRTPQTILNGVMAAELPDFPYPVNAYVRLNSLFLSFLDVTCIIRCRGYCIVTRKAWDAGVTRQLHRLLRIV